MAANKKTKNKTENQQNNTKGSDPAPCYEQRCSHRGSWTTSGPSKRFQEVSGRMWWSHRVIFALIPLTGEEEQSTFKDSISTCIINKQHET